MRNSFLMLLAALCAVSCVSKPPAAAVDHLAPRARILVPDAPVGPVKVDVSLTTKTAQLLTAQGELLAEMDISPGMPGNETPPGRFRVTEKLQLKRSNLYGQYVKPGSREVVVAKHWEYQGPKPPGTIYQGIAMPFWMRLTDDGVGMHVGGFERGQPSSKGCIRCPEDGQRFFYQHCRVGTPVRVHTGTHPVPPVLTSAGKPDASPR
jgi:lipoprotein-anchoring transpeptidase ErfK/SrfK